MEHIVSFLENSNIKSGENSFFIEMAGITYPDKTYHITRQNSGILCLEYVIEGEGDVFVNNNHFHVGQGDVYILPLGKNHDYKSDQKNPFKKIWFNVRGSLCLSLMQIYGLEGIYHIKGVGPSTYNYFTDFLSVCEDKNLALSQMIDKCAIIFHYIMQSLHSKIPSTWAINPSARLSKEFIDKNIYEKLSVNMVAEYISMSPSQLTRVFKSAFNITPYNYIINQKIETSKLLLLNTNMSIKEIAFALSFADEHYFSNAFKKITGRAPSKFSR